MSLIERCFIPWLSTVCLKSVQIKIYSRLYLSLELKGFCWNNGGPASHTVAQHHISIGPNHCKVAFLATEDESVTRIAMLQYIPANTGISPNAVSMLGQRRRLWVNIKTALGECLVIADVHFTK